MSQASTETTSDTELRDMLTWFLHWWFAFHGTPFTDLDDNDKRHDRITASVDEFIKWNRDARTDQQQRQT